MTDCVDPEARRMAREAAADADTRSALAALPTKILAVDGKVCRIDERTKALVSSDGQQNQDIRDLRREVANGFRRIHADHERAQREWAKKFGDQRTPWEKIKDVLIVLTPVIAILVTAYLATHAP